MLGYEQRRTNTRFFTKKSKESNNIIRSAKRGWTEGKLTIKDDGRNKNSRNFAKNQ